jgi:predicted ATPase
VLIVGAYRDLVLGRTHPLSQAIGELVRTPGSQSLHLQGLSEADVAQVLAHSRLTPSAALVTAIHQRTEGNPFFLTEVVHLLEAEGQQSTGGGQDAAMAFSIPQSVQAAIGRRLHPLSADCQHLLQIAAVLSKCQKVF